MTPIEGRMHPLRLAKQFRPMLAATLENRKDLKLPAYASPKIDGIRCLIIDGIPVSRQLKPIPNKYIFKQLADLNLPMLDGELVINSATSKNGFDVSQSGIMSFEGQPDWLYYVFDIVIPGASYKNRLIELRKILKSLYYSRRLQLVPQILVSTRKEFQMAEDAWLEKGYEGVMLRDPMSPYKYGRSTLSQHWLVKVIKKYTAEAIVTGFVERMHNSNEQETNLLGFASHSKKKAGLVPMNTLGALQCRWKDQVKFGQGTFKVGTGFDDATRKKIWSKRAELKGVTTTLEYRELTKDGVPRFPAYKGFRYD